MKYVGIGNEVWGCGGIDVTRRYANFRGAPEGQSLVTVASGPTANLAGYEEFTDTVMKNAKDLFGNVGFQALSLHYYAVPTSDDEDLSLIGAKNVPPTPRAIGFSEDKWANYLRSARAIERAIDTVAGVMDKYDPDKKIALFVDERGAAHQAEPGINAIFQYQQSSLLDAEVAALTLNILQRHTDRVKMANIAQMVNVVQAMILTDKEKMLLTPTYHVFEMYRPFQGAIPYPVEAYGPHYELGGHGLPAVDVSAAKGKDGKLYLALVNSDPHRSADIVTDLMGRARGMILTGPALDTHNTFEAPETIRPTLFSGSRGSDGRVTLKLPAKSVAVVAIERLDQYHHRMQLEFVMGHLSMELSIIFGIFPRNISYGAIRANRRQGRCDFKGCAPMWLSMIFLVAAGSKTSRHATWRTKHRSDVVQAR